VFTQLRTERSSAKSFCRGSIELSRAWNAGLLSGKTYGRPVIETIEPPVTVKRRCPTFPAVTHRLHWSFPVLLPFKLRNRLTHISFIA
jgi:hypothetical protein